MNESIDKETGASAEAIEHHYGTGNDYFALWLDRSMTYSCALWNADDSEQTLDDAQTRKLDYHIEQAHAQGAGRVLDIGCGWGSTLSRLIMDHGVESAVGLTLSESQADWINRTRPEPRIDVRLQSWEDHDLGDASYDAIISIGAFEHFARLGLSSEQKIAIYRRFFGRCHGWLKSRRWMSLQTVAYGNSLQRDFDGFIGQQIFPETDTPRLFEIAAGADRLFEVGGLDLHRITLRKIDSPR